MSAMKELETWAAMPFYRALAEHRAIMNKRFGRQPGVSHKQRKYFSVLQVWLYSLFSRLYADNPVIIALKTNESYKIFGKSASFDSKLFIVCQLSVIV